MRIIDNIKSYFTIDGTPNGSFNNSKLLLGGLALAGVVMMVAASVFGLGFPLMPVAILLPVSIIGVASGLAATAWAVNKLRQERVVPQEIDDELNNDESDNDVQDNNESADNVLPYENIQRLGEWRFDPNRPPNGLKWVSYR